MALVDLHAHTTFSDGHDTPSALVKMAAENNVAVLGITDHDNLGGLHEALTAGEKHGVKIVCGVEITTGFHGHTIHMLGYGLPLNDGELNEFLLKIYRHRKTMMTSLVKKLNSEFEAAGRKTVDIDDFVRSQGEYFNTEKTAQYLVVNGYMSDFEQTMKSLFSILRDGANGLPKQLISSAEAVVAIHRAGGIAILSHPFASGISLRKIDPTPEGQEGLLKEMIADGIDGIECYQSEYGPEETAFALSLTKKYGLLASSGSDWHGAICDVPGDITERKNFYPEHIGGLGTTPEMVAPLLERLGIAVDKVL
jgi:Predicted metal-dependent phosphoesterases (PHP family)